MTSVGLSYTFTLYCQGPKIWGKTLFLRFVIAVFVAAVVFAAVAVAVAKLAAVLQLAAAEIKSQDTTETLHSLFVCLRPCWALLGAWE